MNPIVSAIGGVLGPIVGAVGDYFEGRRQERQQKRDQTFQIEKARVDAQIKAMHSEQGHEQLWELEAIRQAQSSWKDEYALLLVTAPMVIVFVPIVYLPVATFFGWGDMAENEAAVRAIQDAVLYAFSVLGNMPNWYMGVLGAGFAMSFGARALRSALIPKKIRGKK